MSEKRMIKIEPIKKDELEYELKLSRIRAEYSEEFKRFLESDMEYGVIRLNDDKMVQRVAMSLSHVSRKKGLGVRVMKRKHNIYLIKLKPNVHARK